MPIEAMDIIEVAWDFMDCHNDLLGIGKRAFPDKDFFTQVGLVADFILGYENMWLEIGNADTFTQSQQLKEYGVQTLYSDIDHKQRNPDVSALDYVGTFKEFERKLAGKIFLSGKYSSPEDDWYKMQDELAKIVRTAELEKRMESVVVVA